MKLFFIIISIISFCYADTYAQKVIIDINEFTEITIRNNKEIKSSVSEKEIIKQELNFAKVLPNPIISFSSEQLKHSDLDYREYQAEISYPLNFLWERNSSIKSKESLIGFYENRINDKVREISYEARLKYAEQFYLYRLHGALSAALSEVDRLEINAANRFKKGDISEYELNRIVVEVIRMKDDLKEVDKLISNNTKELKIISGIKLDTILTDIDLSKIMIAEDSIELYNQALLNRADYLSLFNLEESENFKMENNNLKNIPNIGILFGYKYQSDKFNGPVFGLDFSIPLFNGNQYNVEINKININQINLEKEFLKQKTKMEIKESLGTLRNLSERLSDINRANLSLIFNTSIYLYDKGEMGITELIDGIKVFMEFIHQKNKIENEYLKTVIHLEKITGKKLILNK